MSSNRVMGCIAYVGVTVVLDDLGRILFVTDSDSNITKEFCSYRLLVLDGVLSGDFGDFECGRNAGEERSDLNLG